MPGKRTKRRDEDKGQDGQLSQESESTSKTKRMCLRSAGPAMITLHVKDEPAAEAEDDPTSPKLLDLPEELILHILSYLPLRDLVRGVRCACPYLRDLTLHPCLWTRLTINLQEPKDGNASVMLKSYSKLLKQQCGSFHHCGSRRATHSSSCSSAVKGEQGEGETGRSSWVKKSVAASVTTLSENISHFYALHMVDAKGKNPVSITEGVVYRNLQHVSLSMYHIPSMAFVSMHRTLRSLSIDWECSCMQYDFKASCQCLQNLQDLFRRLIACKDLETLTISCNKFYKIPDFPFSAKFRAAMISYFATGPRLTHLKLCVLVHNSVVQTILDQCTQLQTLELSNTPLTIRAFAPLLVEPNRSITSLRLNCQIEDPCMVYTISAGFQALTELQLRLVPVPNDNAVEHQKLVQAVTALTVPDLFPKLTNLEVTIGYSKLIFSMSLLVEDPNDSPPPVVVPPSLPISPVNKGMLSRVNIKTESSSNDFNFPLHYLLCYHLELRELKLTILKLKTLSDTDVDLLTGTCQHLETLTLSHSTLSWKQLSLLRSIPSLRSLVCKLDSGPHNLPAEDLQDQAPTPSSSLTHLSIRQWLGISCPNLEALSQLFPGLASLEMYKAALTTQHVGTILRVFNARLETLKLFSVPVDFEEDDWQSNGACKADDCLQLLLTARPPKLREVRIEQMRYPTSPVLLAKVLVHSPSLELFKLTVDPSTYDCRRSTFNKHIRTTFTNHLVFAAVRCEIVKRRREQGQTVQVTRHKKPFVDIVHLQLPNDKYMRVGFTIKRDGAPPSSSAAQFPS